MKKASTIDALIQFFEADGVTPQPIIGATVRFMIKLKLNSADTDALVNLIPTTTVPDSALGKCFVTITASQADTLPNNVPLFCEALAVLESGAVIRTETQAFTLTKNLINALV